MRKINRVIALPIKLEKLENKELRRFECEQLENTNFRKVKIYIMHTGENYNGSVFSEKSIEDSLCTLSNIPILAYVEKTSYEEKDFKGHEMDYDVYEDEDGNLKIREYYKEMPIGVIPESNEYFTEEIDGETYLGCYGYIWKCYSNDAYDILLEDREKEVSMEIYIKECTYDRKNRCNINKFEFLGVTVLGAKVPGAMGKDCQLSMDFSVAEDYKEYSEAVDKLNKFLKFQRKESVAKVNEDNKNFEQTENEELEKFADEDEVCTECGKNPCECEDSKEEEACKKKKNNAVEEDEEEDDDKKEECSTDEEVDDKKEEEACKKKKNNAVEDEEDKDEEKCSTDEEEKEEEACKKKENNSVEDNKEDFSLSLNNIFKGLREALSDYTYTYTSFWGDEFECNKYYVEDLIPGDSKVIIYDSELGEYFGATYSIDKDTVSCDLDNKQVYIREWRAKEEGSSRFELEEKEKREAVIYNMIAEEYHELKKFKEDTIKAQEDKEFNEKVDNILSQFNFTNEEVEDLVKQVNDKSLSLEMFENMLYAIEGRKYRAEKEKFSKVNNEEENGLGVYDGGKETTKKVKYQDIIEQYGKKNK